MLENRIQVGFGDKEQISREICIGSNAPRPHFDLPFRLLTRYIQDPEPGCHFEGHLQHQGGLADARVTTHQHDRTGDQATAQHPGKLTN